MGLFPKGRPSSQEPPQEAGLYRVVDRESNSIDYIGLTNDLDRRYKEHFRSGRFSDETHDFQWQPANTDAMGSWNDLREYEAKKIAEHNPPMNEKSGGGGRTPHLWGSLADVGSASEPEPEIGNLGDRDNAPNQVSNSNDSHSPFHRPTRDTAEAPTGNGAIGIALVAVFGYGLYRLHKWLSNDGEVPPTTPAEEAHTADMERLIRSTNSDDLVDAIRKDLDSHLEQPGSIFYRSTEFEMPELVGHFGRFKDPKDIDLFIRGEERPMVLSMAELRKEELAA